MAIAVDGFQPLLSEITSQGSLSSQSPLALCFLSLSLSFDVPSDSLGESQRALPRLWLPLSACWGWGLPLSSRPCFLDSAGLMSTPGSARPRGCGSWLGGYPGVCRMPKPCVSPVHVSEPGVSSGAGELRTGGSPIAWWGPIITDLGFSFRGALRLFFLGSRHTWAWGSWAWGMGGASGLGWEAAALCSPCCPALWWLRPGPEWKEAEHTSQVTGCLLVAWSFQWPFSVAIGFFLKP